MSIARNIVGADIFDQNLEHVALLSNELLPSEYFTSDLAEFCDHAAYHSDVHSISMPIILLNVAATSTEKSGIWRSNGASSGGIIVTALQRKSNGSQVDAFFERLMIWCLRPPPLIWKIAAEYLRINGYFTSCISNDFISNIRQIFERLHSEDSSDKRTHMRIPDDPVRAVSPHSNKVQSDAVERTSINRKLEKSKSKYSEHVRGILLFKSVIFTSTTLYKACSVFRHHSGNVNSVLQELLKMGLIIAFDNRIISSTKKALVYAKWLPNVNDLVECQRFEQMLATFNDDLISADSIIACTTAVSLLPHKANPKPAVLNYLKNERYAQLKLDFCANNLASEDNIG
ncbi:unnamed protein product [Rotaria sordida]|uniref:Uncharacterized protein n=2 Tax=Rotaria sordida TaxID=392033 RepID=A0A814B8W4_9BILA|nr:unnamed protein product [Rotaria sordida]CAF3981743.1 unnamed protein product [Rotaria sordida]